MPMTTTPAPPFRLTDFARGGGCAAKLRLGSLATVLATAPRGAARAGHRSWISTTPTTPRSCTGARTARDLVLTTDTIAPLVDDPETFGAIAATNAMSDVWAMGGEPRFALNLVFFSDEQLPLEVLGAILAGGARACAAAGVAIVGGHSVRDPEVKYGLAVTGDVAAGRGVEQPHRARRSGARAHQGARHPARVISQAIKKQVASAPAIAAAGGVDDHAQPRRRARRPPPRP